MNKHRSVAAAPATVASAVLRFPLSIRLARPQTLVGVACVVGLLALPALALERATGSPVARAGLAVQVATDPRRPIPKKQQPKAHSQTKAKTKKKAKTKAAPRGGKSVQGTVPSAGVIVAVVDGGVDVTHPAFAGHLWVNPDEIAGNGVDDDRDGFADDVNGANFVTPGGDLHDDVGHGTHVAGIILQADPNARVMALKAGTGHFVDIGAATTAIRYAVDHGARVINLSWAFQSGSGELESALAYAGSHDVLVVAAAGNFSFDNDLIPTYPASYGSDTLVSVGATCDGRTVAAFSDFGKLSVSLVAPGCDVRSTVPGGAYALMSGTSMASPAVAGAAALVLERYPKLHAAQLKNALLGGGQPEPDLANSVQAGTALSLDGSLAAAATPDLTPPASFSALSPSRTFQTERDPSYYYQEVAFAWTASRDAALAGYRVIVDGVAVAGAGPSATSVTVKVAPGAHTWSVVAFDRSGNATTGSG